MLASRGRPAHACAASARIRSCHSGCEANSIKPHIEATAVTSKPGRYTFLQLSTMYCSGVNGPSSPVLVLSMMTCGSSLDTASECSFAMSKMQEFCAGTRWEIKAHACGWKAP
eukprot:XP_019072662.1 PREDICTED: uncharacterized protein LOC104877601 isoform X1 [Vitis vinifera]